MDVRRRDDVPRAGRGGGCLDHDIDALHKGPDGGGIAQIGLMPDDARKIVSRPSEPNGMDLEVAAARQALHEIAADEAGGSADENALTGHRSRVRQWPGVAPLPLYCSAS